MKFNYVNVVYSTHLNDDEISDYNKHISDTIGCNHAVYPFKNYNQYSLSEVYNMALRKQNGITKNEIYVFIHHDLVFKTKNWGKILLNKFNNFNVDIIGLAGSTYLDSSGVWWAKKEHMYGVVEHTNGYVDWVSNYGSDFKGLKNVVVVDGLFIAVNPNNVLHDFNEEFSGFHFYEIPFCIDNYIDGSNIAITNEIRVLHKSIGKTNEEWEKNREIFIGKNKQYLPIKVLPDFKKKILISCMFFRGFTGSEISILEQAKELVKNSCEVTIVAQFVGEPLKSIANKYNISVYSINSPPNYDFLNGKYIFNSKKRKEFDLLHLNHKPISELILKLYSTVPAVMHIRSNLIPKIEEPIINDRIYKYISIEPELVEHIKSFGINEDKITIIKNIFNKKRFNNSNKNKNSNVVLFIGTINHIRKNVLLDAVERTKKNNQELWILGNDEINLIKSLKEHTHVKLLGIKKNVETYIKKSDYTVAIYKGRTMIESFLCGVPVWGYWVDSSGNINKKEILYPPNDISEYYPENSIKKILELYNDTIYNEQ